MVSVLPTLEEYDNRFLTEFEHAKEVIAGIRNIRKQNNVAFKEAIVLKIKSNERYPKKFESIIRKMGNIERVEEVSDSVKGAWSFIADTVEYFIPARRATEHGRDKSKIRNGPGLRQRFSGFRHEKTRQREIRERSPGTSNRKRKKEAGGCRSQN